MELRTDSRNYFDFCVDLLTNLNKASIKIDVNRDLEVVSKYEDRWKKQGKNIYDVVLTSQNIDEKLNINYSFEFNFDINFDNFIKMFLQKL